MHINQRLTKKQEKLYKKICHDLAEITRVYIKEGQYDCYPQFRPGFRGYVARELMTRKYRKLVCWLGNAGLIED